MKFLSILEDYLVHTYFYASRLLEDGIDGIIFGYLPSPRQAICGNVE